VYTRPYTFNKLKVPDILISGDKNKIESWREKKSLEKTKRLRPDLLKK
jgi:tRNA (guanine37-N1)-methyltransferase